MITFIMITLILVIILVLGTGFLIGFGIIYMENRGFIDIQFNDPTTGRRDISKYEWDELTNRERKRMFKNCKRHYKRKIKKIFKRK